MERSIAVHSLRFARESTRPTPSRSGFCILRATLRFTPLRPQLLSVVPFGDYTPVAPGGTRFDVIYRHGAGGVRSPSGNGVLSGCPSLLFAFCWYRLMLRPSRVPIPLSPSIVERGVFQGISIVAATSRCRVFRLTH